MYVRSKLPLETPVDPTINNPYFPTFLPGSLYTQSSFVFSSFIDTKRVRAGGTEGKGEMGNGEVERARLREGVETS